MLPTTTRFCEFHIVIFVSFMNNMLLKPEMIMCLFQALQGSLCQLLGG